MRMSQAFPSKYLKAEDIGNNRPTVTMSHVAMEDIGDDDAKPVLYFQGKTKGLVLNKTNASQISYLYGDETDEWAGKTVELFTMMVTFQGRQVPAIRVAPPPGRSMEGQRMPDGRPTLDAPPKQSGDLDDEVPF